MNELCAILGQTSIFPLNAPEAMADRATCYFQHKKFNFPLPSNRKPLLRGKAWAKSRVIQGSRLMSSALHMSEWDRTHHGETHCLVHCAHVIHAHHLLTSSGAPKTNTIRCLSCSNINNPYILWVIKTRANILIHNFLNIFLPEIEKYFSHL